MLSISLEYPSFVLESWESMSLCTDFRDLKKKGILLVLLVAALFQILLRVLVRAHKQCIKASCQQLETLPLWPFGLDQV
jgi:hypothetical protein